MFFYMKTTIALKNNENMDLIFFPNVLGDQLMRVSPV
jgi:hypothetical protein